MFPPQVVLGFRQKISVMVEGIRLRTVLSLISHRQWAPTVVPGKGWKLGVTRPEESEEEEALLGDEGRRPP